MLRHAHALMEMDWKVKEALNMILLAVEKQFFTIDELRSFIEEKMRNTKVLPF